MYFIRGNVCLKFEKKRLKYSIFVRRFTLVDLYVWRFDGIGEFECPSFSDVNCSENILQRKLERIALILFLFYL